MNLTATPGNAGGLTTARARPHALCGQVFTDGFAQQNCSAKNIMHDLVKEIRALSQSGLHYTKDPFDRERFERLIKIASQLYANLSDSDLDAVEKFFIPEKGYATPKVDLRACVFKDSKVMLVRERSDNLWTLPGGWADQNESPCEGILREIKEESGFDTEIHALYAVKDRDRNPYKPKYPVSIYKMFFTASITGGSPQANLEVSEIDFFDEDDLPPLSEERVLAQDIYEGFQAYRNTERKCSFD